MSKKWKNEEHPHLGLAIFATGVMSLALAAGLQYLGLVARLDRALASWFSPSSLGMMERGIHPLLLWCSTAFLAFGLAAVMLNIPGSWRRLLIWAMTVVLTFCWGPVLVLSAYKPEIGVAIIAIIWSGICSMVYAVNHILPVDKADNQGKEMADGTR
ncbi:hypothetical protein ACFSSA_06525 [Luteolibacter algae]|uniref:Uncharacterized protein n=1 Tax=Luteolibacter algae TaxID=454151 RepID=A0ABW5D5G8_9BACT